MSESLIQVQEAVAQVIDAHERLLANRTTDAIISSLARAAESWLQPTSPWRAQALEEGPPTMGFSREMIGEIIDLTFGAFTTAALGELVDRELGSRRVLDEFTLQGHAHARATGPRLITHFLAGNIPAPGINSICCGLLLRSANLVKVSASDPLFPWLFVESLRAVDPELAECVATIWWPRADADVTAGALGKADAVIAYGDDNSVKALRELTPPTTRFIGYGHKVSFAVLAREALTQEAVPALAAAVALDVSLYDQQGCLSPHMIFVEEGGQAGARTFAAALAEAMAEYHARVPSAPLSITQAAQVSNLRNGYEYRAQSDRRVAVWTGPNPNHWGVIYEDEPTFTPSCLNRLVFVKPTDGYKRVLNTVRRFAPLISSVGMAPLNERAIGFANDLARIGVNRICPIGQMQRPPLTWHHDGRPNLTDLVRWTDLG